VWHFSGFAFELIMVIARSVKLVKVWEKMHLKVENAKVVGMNRTVTFGKIEPACTTCSWACQRHRFVTRLNVLMRASGLTSQEWERVFEWGEKT
jgi:hypothetical protein